MDRLRVLPLWLYSLLAVLATGIFYFFSTGLDGFRLLVWIAPIPILVLAFRLPARWAVITAFSAYLFGGFNVYAYLARLTTPVVAIASATIPAIAFALAILATRYAVLQFKHWSTVLVFPVIWTSYEYLLSIVSPHGTAGSLAYTQTDILPLIQIASLTGIWGVTFILTLIPSGMAVGWHLRESRKQLVSALMVPLVMSLLVFSYGWIRLAQPIAGQPIKVGLASTDTTIQYFETQKREEALPVVQAYTRRIAELASQGAEVVVLPEKFVGVTQAYLGDVVMMLGKAARDNKVTVIAGLNLMGPNRNQNIALIFSPDGQLLAQYQKVYLIPGFESNYQPGTKPVVFSIINSQAGVTICKDMDFPGWTKQYTGLGARILFVPSWDFVQDGRLHSRMAVVRGIEDGVAVVRSAQQGLVTVSNYLGQVLAEDKSSSAADVLLVSQVQLGPGHTFYSLIGDWFAWLNLLGLTLILIMIISRTLRKSRE